MAGRIDGIFVELKANVDAKGVVTGEQKIVDSARSIKKEFASTDASINRSSQKMSKSTKAVGKSMGGMGRSAGQASIQLQQFTGQVSGGVNPLIAFSQQAADLGIVMGAPLLGSIVGIGAAIGVVLLPELFKSTDALKNLEAIADSLKRSLDQSSSGVLGLSENLQKLAERSRPLAKLQISASIVEAEKQITVASDGIVDAVDDMFSSFQGAMSISEAGDAIRRFGGDVNELSKNIEGTNRLSMAALSSKLDQVSRRFGISKESAAGFILAIDELNRTKSPAAVKNLENQLTKLNEETNGSSKRLNELSKATIPLFEAMNSGVDSVNLLRMAFTDLNAELRKPAEAKALTEAEVVAGALAQQVQLANAELGGGANAARRLALALELGLTNANQLPESIKGSLSALEEVEAKTKAMAVAERNEAQKTAQLKAQLKSEALKVEAERGSNLERLRAEILSEQDLLIAKNASEIQLLESSLIAGEVLRDEYDEIKKAKAIKLAGELTGIAERAAKAEQAIEEAKANAKISSVSQTFGNLASLMNSGSKKMFEIGKKAAIAGAIVDNGAAIVKTMASVPYPFNIPLAASQAVAGAMQIKQIQSQQFNGGGSATSFSGGLPAVNTQQAAPQQNQNISISGIDKNSLISGGQLVDTLNQALGDGFTINFSGR
jgi:hypothetical protein